MSRLTVKTVLALAIASVAVGAIAFFMSDTYPYDDLPFNSHQWKTSAPTGTFRYKMLDDLIRGELQRSPSEDYVISLLGNPTEHYNGSEGGDSIYSVGPTNRMGMRRLNILYDLDGHVRKAWHDAD